MGEHIRSSDDRAPKLIVVGRPGGRLMHVTASAPSRITTDRDRVRLGSDEPLALLAAVERARAA